MKDNIVKESSKSKNKNLGSKQKTDVKVSEKRKNNNSSLAFIFSIRFRLIISYVLPVLFIIALGIISYNKSKSAIKESYMDAAVSAVGTTSEYFELLLSSVEQKMTQFKNDDRINKYITGYYEAGSTDEMLAKKAAADFLTSAAFSDNTIGTITFFGAKSDFISSWGEIKISGKEFTDNFEQTSEGEKVLAAKGKYVWQGYHTFIDENTKSKSSAYAPEYALAVESVYYDGRLRKLAYITSDIKLNVVLDQLNSLDIGEDSIFGVVTEDGKEITNVSDGNTYFYGTDFYNTAFASEEMSGLSNESEYGKDYVFVYSKIGNSNIMVCGLIPYSYLLKASNSIRNVTVIFVIISVIIAGLIGIVLSTGIGNIIQKINKILSQAADGDLTVSVDCKRRDEFATLGNSANDMILNMKDLIKHADVVKDAVLESSNDVTKSADELSGATGNIKGAIEEIRKGIVQQADDSQDCLMLADDLTKEIGEVTNNAREIVTIVDDTKNAVRGGIESIDNINENSKKTAKITAEAIKDIEHLSKESQDIGQIIGAINDIAEQTNLLSLNASIEAARAGESGRGFAVVADEIRKLAEQSSQSASKIADIVESIQAKTGETVNTVKKAGEIVASQDNVINSAVEKFDNINTAVENMLRKINTIIEGIERIDDAKTKTLQSIESISAVSEETAAASESVESAAEAQVDAVSKLNKATNELSLKAEELDIALKSFKVR